MASITCKIHLPVASDLATPVFIELLDIDFGSFDCRPSAALAVVVLTPSAFVEAELPLFDAFPEVAVVAVLDFGGEAVLSFC